MEKKNLVPLIRLHKLFQKEQQDESPKNSECEEE